MGHGFIHLPTIVSLKFISTSAFGSIFIHGKIHEIIIGFYCKMFISPFSVMNTKTQVATEETTTMYGIVFQTGQMRSKCIDRIKC
jgi:hypothetical protein